LGRKRVFRNIREMVGGGKRYGKHDTAEEEKKNRTTQEMKNLGRGLPSTNLEVTG